MPGAAVGRHAARSSRGLSRLSRAAATRRASTSPRSSASRPTTPLHDDGREVAGEAAHDGGTREEREEPLGLAGVEGEPTDRPERRQQ